MGNTLYSSKRNDLLLFYFFYMITIKDGFHYTLILKDDLSRYVWLILAIDVDAETVADSVIKCFSKF